MSTKHCDDTGAFIIRDKNFLRSQDQEELDEDVKKLLERMSGKMSAELDEEGTQ